MDNCHLVDVSCIEKDLNYVEPVRKRRSSVFQSRVVVFDECEGEQVAENENVNAADIVKYPPKAIQKECFNLEEYISNLKKERKQWIEILKKRKTERKNLEKQRLCLEKQGQPLDTNALTESERDFVIARPNYQHIYKRYKMFSELTMKISLLHDMVYNLNQRFIFEMDRRLHKITEKVIESSG